MSTDVGRAADLLHREARYLDRKQWDEWLALYEPDATFWLPSWDDRGELIDDPRREISLIYYSSRKGLEDRVARIRSGQSAASSPPPRTCHLLSGIFVESKDDATATVGASFTVHTFRRGRTETFYGHYDYTLRKHPERWTIARKRIVLLNDVIPSALDVFSV